MTFYGDGATFTFDPGAAAYDQGGADDADFMFTNTSDNHVTFIYGLNLTFNIPSGKTRATCDIQLVLGYGAGNLLAWAPVIQNSTFTDFSGTSVNRATLIKNNMVGWSVSLKNGTATRQSNILAKGNSAVLLNYSKPDATESPGNSHFNYINLNTPYHFMFDNFHYAENPANNSTFFKVYSTTGGSVLNYVYVQNNYGEGARFGPFDIYDGGGYGSAVGPIHIKDNFFHNVKTGGSEQVINFLGTVNSTDYTDIVISGNSYSFDNTTITGNFHLFKCGSTGSCDGSGDYKYDNMTIEDNNFGAGVSPIDDCTFNDVTGEDCYYWYDRAVQDQGIVVQNNIRNSTNYQKSDPGPWEFTAPVNGGNSASGGSGFGTTRWPFSHTGYIQFAHADGETFSEINNCTNSDCSIFDGVSPGGSFTQSRFADNDGNLSGLAAYTILQYII
jgi:hypothetical protein